MVSRHHYKSRFFFQLLAVLILIGFIGLILYPDIYESPLNILDPEKIHFLAIVVPFRDRFEELLEFVPHIHLFLKLQNINHVIIIVNQADDLRFNRGALINIGFRLSEDFGCDYMAMHDIDLLPINSNLLYKYREDSIHHIASPHLHPLYHYEKFLGGIVIINNHHYKLVNGMTNRFWGWGREDDEFYLRIKNQNINISRPIGIITGLKTFKHLHNKYRRKRDNVRYGNQKINTRRDYETGLSTISYNFFSNYTITIEGITVYVFNVQLKCDVSKTPWCMNPHQVLDYINSLNGTVSEPEYDAIVEAVRKHNMI